MEIQNMLLLLFLNDIKNMIKEEKIDEAREKLDFYIDKLKGLD